MDKIYIVTRGSYSDYRIEEVFSTKEKAEEYKKNTDEAHYDAGCIEEYDIDNPDFSSYRTIVGITQTGEVKSVKLQDYGWPEYKNGILYWPVDTIDKARAIKVANEKRAAILALNIWGNDKAVRELIK